MRRLRKGTPGDGGGQRPDCFSYTPVKEGLKGSFSAYVAGETYWCDEAHEHKPPFLIGSKPCLHWITEGELQCARCRKQPAVMKLGWVPLWRETDHAPIIVIVHQDAHDLVSGLRYGQAVLVGRVTETSTVYVRASESGVWFKTDNPFRKRAVDITKDLLAMWQLPELTNWLKSRPPDEVDGTEVPAPLRQRLSVPPPTSEVEALAIDAEKKAPRTWDEVVKENLQHKEDRSKSAQRNGKHKPEGEGS